MMNSRVALLTLALANAAAAFHVQIPPTQRRRTVLVLHDKVESKQQQDVPMTKERAKYCAEHFGECSVEEMEQARGMIHKERIQNFMYGGSGGTRADDGAMEDLVLEEELDLQLNMLKEKTPDPSLFPEVEDKMQELPHLKDGTRSGKLEAVLHEAEHDLAIAESVLEESTLETLAICTVVLAAVLLPQIMN